MALSTRLTPYLDTMISPQTRERVIQQLLHLAVSRPYLSSYLAVFLFFAFLPLLGLTVSVIFLAVILGATAAFWVGVALVITAGFLTVAAMLATCVYVYLLGVFIVGRWCRNMFLPEAAEAAEGRVEVRHRQREREKPVKMEGEEEEEDGSHDDSPSTPRVAPGNRSFTDVVLNETLLTGGEDPEREKMRRDIERSLK
ncbi:hypothetical protein BDD12DRAFT_911681 [Trichophaea hybrida]|nr:hypothetical protein BDD12DRAFT_911681 [Trichophaea hybrida]